MIKADKKMDFNLEKLSISKSIDIKSNLNETLTDSKSYKLAGFVNEGRYAWIASHDSLLRVISTETGEEVAYYNFKKHHKTRGCVISCVEEIRYAQGSCILAIGIEFTSEAGGVGMLSVFSVNGSKILGSMDMCERITCIHFIDRDMPSPFLSKYNGILAVGTEQGKLFLVDLMLPQDISQEPSYDSEIFPMYNIQMDQESEEIYAHHQKAVQNREQGEKCFFTLQLKEVLSDSGAVLSILALPNTFLMSVGLDDGRMVLYDLDKLEAFHLAYPPGNHAAPLTKMSYIEPIHDPRKTVYVWAFHAMKEGPVAVLHTIVFESNREGIYRKFLGCDVGLTILIPIKGAYPISCISISKPVTSDDEDLHKLCLLSCTSPQQQKSYLIVFDLNQWYKAQLPKYGDLTNKLKYIVVFETLQEAMDISCDPKNLMAFDSLDRPEEHFLPTSLSFNVTYLENQQFTTYRRSGIQMQVLQKFDTIGPYMLFSPNKFYNEMRQVFLCPQFYEITFNTNTSIELKREFLLSIALEYNHIDFLMKCAHSWYDGAMFGEDKAKGLSLSTLTDWIWNRSRVIKESSNEYSRTLFDYSSQPIDCGTQKHLSSCFRQLKALSTLFHTILTNYSSSIAQEIVPKLEKQSLTIRLAAEYQEVLQWLLNVGLLPEGRYPSKGPIGEDFIIVPYPYQIIHSRYEAQRASLSSMGNQKRDKFSTFLFIDAFIENECGEGKLREIWGCSYPPKSIQSLLRILLVEEICLEKKFVIFIYLFMDISTALHDTPYSSIVKNLIKFPTVFKINPAIIKQTQAYWNLDNGSLDVAVDELISPLSNDKELPRWKRELLICVLLKQNASDVALKVLKSPGVPISTALELNTLLANELFSEALLVQRRSGDRELLEEFYCKLLNSPNYGQLLDLTLNKEEGLILREFLENTDFSNGLNLHFVFLLQRNKFVEATELMDRINNNNEKNLNLDLPKQVLNAYYSKMDIMSQKLSKLTAFNDVGSTDCLLPLSSNLIRSRCNASNDIYKECIKSINHAVFDRSSQSNETKEMPFIGSPNLGIFEYRQETTPKAQEVHYQNDINVNGKRILTEEPGVLNTSKDIDVKRRRINEKEAGSFIDTRIQTLTRFRKIHPRMQSKTRSLSRTPQRTPPSTPKHVIIGETANFLATPVVKERTPPQFYKQQQDKCPGTPHSILKTRSNRGSASPSRFSEIDDNKSVKSITFAMPSTRESSVLQDSSYLEESFGGTHENEDQFDSSAAEVFFSPEKLSTMENDEEEESVERHIISRSPSPAKAAQEIYQPAIIHEDILKSSSDSDGSETACSQDKSIYNFVRKSVLPDDFAECDTSSSLGSDESGEYGDINIEDSSTGSNSNGSSESNDSITEKRSISMQSEIIEIPDSDDEDVIASTEKLPSIMPQILPFNETSNEPTSHYTELQTFEMAPSNEQMVNVQYEDIESEEKNQSDTESNVHSTYEEVKLGSEITANEQQDDIESPPFENISPTLSHEEKSQEKLSNEILTFEEENLTSNNNSRDLVTHSELITDLEKSQAMSNTESNVVEVSSNSKVNELLEKSNNEDDQEIQEILKNALDSDAETQKTPKKGKLRKALSQSQKRAVSVPISTSFVEESSSPRSHPKSSRATSELRSNPKDMLKEKILERIDEQPGRLTRTRSKILQSRETTPVTPSQNSRAPSEEVDSVKKLTRGRSQSGTPSTPHRMVTRALSKESVASDKTPEEAKSSQSRRGRKKTPEVNLDVSESLQKSPESDDPLKTRRLTRSQLNILEKSRSLSRTIQQSSTSLRATKSDLSGHQEDDISDSESVKSESASSRTSSRAGRKRKTPKHFDDFEEVTSVGSKSSRKSKSPVKKGHLTAIPEEDLKEDALSETSRSSRKASQRNKK